MPLDPASAHAKNVHTWPISRGCTLAARTKNETIAKNAVDTFLSSFTRNFVQEPEGVHEAIERANKRENKKVKPGNEMSWLKLPYHPSVERLACRAVGRFNSEATAAALFYIAQNGCNAMLRPKIGIAWQNELPSHSALVKAASASKMLSVTVSRRAGL